MLTAYTGTMAGSFLGFIGEPQLSCLIDICTYTEILSCGPLNSKAGTTHAGIESNKNQENEGGCPCIMAECEIYAWELHTKGLHPCFCDFPLMTHTILSLLPRTDFHNSANVIDHSLH